MSFITFQYAVGVQIVLITTCALLLPAFSGRDFSFTPGTKLFFTDTETETSFSNDLVVPIINDNFTEPCESFICTLQGGDADTAGVRYVQPNQVTIEICDDDGEYMQILCFVLLLFSILCWKGYY